MITTHWLHVALSWASALGLFAVLGGMALARHRAAKRALDALERRT